MNTKPYCLQSTELIKLAIFNGIGNYYGFNRKTVEEQIEVFEKKLFVDVLKNAPNLRTTIDKFYNLYREESAKPEPNTFILYYTFFNEKISAKEFGNTFFTSNYSYGNDPDRASFLKKMQDKYPPFVFMIHKYITENKDTKILPFAIYDSYFQILKNKTAKESLSKIDKKEILKNINSFKPQTTTNIKKKINAYLNNFEKKEPLYKHISNELKEEISKYGLIKNYWDEKVKLFSPEVIKKHQSLQSEKISWGKEEEFYTYKLFMNKEFITQQTNYSESTSESLCYCFTSSLKKFVSSKFNGMEFNNHGNPFLVLLSFENENDKNKAKRFCNDVINKLDEIVANYLIKDKGHSNIQEGLEKYFEKLYFSFELDKQLPKKNENLTPKNIKKI